MQLTNRLPRKWMFALELSVPALATAMAASSYTRKARVAGLVSRLRQRPPAERATYSEADLEGLPAPAARYFRAVLRDGHRLVRHATLAQSGEILVRTRPPLWRHFDATKSMTAGGFVWDARIGLFPGVTFCVCDSSIGGTGAVRVSALGVPLMHLEGTREIAAGALIRYLAEAVWMPTALLPGQGVTWTALDDTSARATITCGATTVSLDFHFDAEGLVERVFTDARPREVEGDFVRAPWQGHFTQYDDVNGIRIPFRAEAEWLHPEGPRPYWRGSITAVTFEYEPLRF